MILTITLNPSVVREIELENLNVGGENFTDKDRLYVGDSGIYSAYIIKVMQGEPYVLSVSGGIGGRFIKNFLDRNRIRTDFLQLDHEARTLMLVKDGEQVTRIMSHNEKMTIKDFNNLKHKLNRHLNDVDIVTLSGSDILLPNLLTEIHKLSKKRKKIILGAWDEALAGSIENYIYAAIVSAKDMDLLGLNYPETKEEHELIRLYLRSKHIRYFIIQGETEIIGYTKNKIVKINYHQKDDFYNIIKSTVIGGVTIGVQRGYSFEKMMKLIGAIAGGCSVHEFPMVIRRKEIDWGVKHGKIIEVYNHRNGYITGGSNE